MKCIEDEIPFELPEGWSWARLGNLSAAIQYGLSNSAETQGTHRLLRITDIQDGKVDWNTVPYTTTDAQDTYLLKSGDIVFARTGATVGKSFLITETPYPSVYASYLIRIRLLGNLSSEYIYQFFDSACYWSQITDKSVGVGQPNCNGTSLKELFIPLPPINEQLKIVPTVQELLKYVSAINADRKELLSIIANAKAKILDLAIRGQLVPQNPDDEPASVLLERIRTEKEELIRQGKIKHDKKESVIFKGEDNSYYETTDNNTECIDGEIPFDLPDGWVWCRLKSLAAPHENSFVDGPFGSNLKTDHYTENREVRIIQLNNIGEFVWKNNGIKYTTYKHAESLERCKSYSGDIVIAKMMPAGRTIIVPDIEDIYVISSDCVRLQLPEYIDTEYIMYMMNSPTINEYILKDVQGIGRTRTSLGKLKELLVPIPPYNQQLYISKIIKKVLKNFDAI